MLQFSFWNEQCVPHGRQVVKKYKKESFDKSKEILLIGKGVCVLGSLDDGPSRHQLYEASSCEEHDMEVARGELDVTPSSSKTFL